MGKKIKDVITEYEIIKEVGSICAGNSTHVFSQMINRCIKLEAPELEVVSFKDIDTVLQSSEKIVVGVHCKLLTKILGQISLLFLEKSAYEFVSIFATPGKMSPGFLTQLGVSTIKEVGNVVVSAYAGAMSLLMNEVVIPSIPVLSSGPLKEAIKFGMTNFKNTDKIYVHRMLFVDNERRINGSFFLVLGPDVVAHISNEMRNNLKEIGKMKDKLRKAMD
ncbi:MAG: chemotaxis protein CheC [Candidatus Omnitrophica bacterium]|nr:chemotaxis protein CheC [Candidatus Omnitrophota bacterium]MBU4478101.1 chemotaxis protein CheC [Candidatus Omnitrophota bacterium]MCG2702924.1 chemotaxis protein CheC [Candidatus Omnitrophota bacterium]